MIDFREKNTKMYFAWGFLLGILCFLAVYGVKVLNVGYDGWIYKSKDLDIQQHYIGWLAFRNSAWTFPLGMVDSLSYPVPMSIIFTDSIPLFALVFKAISPLLPETFQYFGIFAIMSFALTGAYSADILRKTTNNVIIPLVMPVIFVLSHIMLTRTFYHTSLGAQWIILLGIDLWISGIARTSAKKQVTIWSAVGLLCVLVHLYFLPMLLCIICGTYLEVLLSDKKRDFAMFRTMCIVLASFIVVALISLYAMGGFASPSSEEYWVGDFGVNLNSFVNSLNHSILLKGLPLVSDLQYEGVAYLGLGILVLLLAELLYGVLYFVKSSDKHIVEMLLGHPRRASVAVVCTIFAIVSILPMVSLGSHVIYTVPYSESMLRIIGIFRSNGRFIWPVVYFIFIGAIVISDRIYVPRRHMTTALIVLTALIQITDISPWLMKKANTYHNARDYFYSEWDKADIPEDYSYMVSFQKDNEFLMRMASYSVRHGMKANRFYFARGIDAILDDYADKSLSEILNGEYSEDTIYVFDRDTYELVKDTGLLFYKSDKCVYGVAEPIKGKQQLLSSDLEQVKWP